MFHLLSTCSDVLNFECISVTFLPQIFFFLTIAKSERTHNRHSPKMRYKLPIDEHCKINEARVKKLIGKIWTLNIICLGNSAEKIIYIMDKRKNKILGLADIRHKGTSSRKEQKGYMLIYSGGVEAKNGAGFLIHLHIHK